MIEINPITLIPEAVRQKAMDVAVDVVVQAGDGKLPTQTVRALRGLRSDGAFQLAFEDALGRAGQRFVREYINQDEDLVDAIAQEVNFFADEQVQAALLTVLRNPGLYQKAEQRLINQSFDGILPRRRNRERVNRAVNFFLRCLQEEVWNLPELHPIYQLQFQRLTAEAAQAQVALQQAQLAATTHLSQEIRSALLALTQAMATQMQLSDSNLTGFQNLSGLAKLPRHNLPQPDYERFIGRAAQLKQIRELLAPDHRSWVLTIDGIGGIGKSALALEVADNYRHHYAKLPESERFEAIVWVTAKQNVLTGEGIMPRRQSLRTLNDIYTAIAVTLQREDVFTQQRTLLIIDNLETVDDEQVMARCPAQPR